MDSSVSPKGEMWFLRMCYHISNAVYKHVMLLLHLTKLRCAKTCCGVMAPRIPNLRTGRRWMVELDFPVATPSRHEPPPPQVTFHMNADGPHILYESWRENCLPKWLEPHSPVVQPLPLTECRLCCGHMQTYKLLFAHRSLQLRGQIASITLTLQITFNLVFPRLT